MKYKVLIVDDDLNFVEQVQDMINWEQIGLQIVDIEILGIAGLGKFFTYEPDILLLSESVYIMSGEEFLHLIQKAQHSYRVIYLAQKPLANQAFPQVIACLDKAVLSPERLTETFFQTIAALKRERGPIPYDCNGTADSALANEHKRQGLRQLFEQISTFQFENLRKRYCLHIHDTDLVLIAIRPPSAQDDYAMFISRISQALEEYGNGEQVTLEMGVHCILFNLPVGNVIYQNKILEQMLNRLLQVVNGAEPRKHRLYASNIMHITALNAEFGNIVEMMQYDYFNADRQIVKKKLHTASDDSLIIKDAQRLCDEMQECILSSDHQQLAECLKELFLALLKNSMSIPLRCMIRKKCTAIYELIGDTLPGKRKLAQPSEPFLYIEDEHKWYQEEFMCLAKQVEQEKLHVHACVLYAQQYILRHYCEEISLQTVAGQIGISKSYLCSLFKKDLLIGFTDYLNQLRVTKAKELLSAGKNVKTAALAVGYSDPKYFSRVFKELNGQPPKAFQRLAGSQKAVNSDT